jgi:hypothetical protein
MHKHFSKLRSRIQSKDHTNTEKFLKLVQALIASTDGIDQNAEVLKAIQEQLRASPRFRKNNETVVVFILVVWKVGPCLLFCESHLSLVVYS